MKSIQYFLTYVMLCFYIIGKSQIKTLSTIKSVLRIKNGKTNFNSLNEKKLTRYYYKKYLKNELLI
jgi:hypothetical protein